MKKKAVKKGEGDLAMIRFFVDRSIRDRYTELAKARGLTLPHYMKLLTEKAVDMPLEVSVSLGTAGKAG